MCASVPFTRFDDDNTDCQVFGQVDGSQHGEGGDDDDSAAKCVCVCYKEGGIKRFPFGSCCSQQTPAPPLYHLDLSACTH